MRDDNLSRVAALSLTLDEFLKSAQIIALRNNNSPLQNVSRALEQDVNAKRKNLVELYDLTKSDQNLPLDAEKMYKANLLFRDRLLAPFNQGFLQYIGYEVTEEVSKSVDREIAFYEKEKQPFQPPDPPQPNEATRLILEQNVEHAESLFNTSKDKYEKKIRYLGLNKEEIEKYATHFAMIEEYKRKKGEASHHIISPEERKKLEDAANELSDFFREKQEASIEKLAALEKEAALEKGRLLAIENNKKLLSEAKKKHQELGRKGVYNNLRTQHSPVEPNENKINEIKNEIEELDEKIKKDQNTQKEWEAGKKISPTIGVKIKVIQELLNEVEKSGFIQQEREDGNGSNHLIVAIVLFSILGSAFVTYKIAYRKRKQRPLRKGKRRAVARRIRKKHVSWAA